jgi:hypothetical protein
MVDPHQPAGKLTLGGIQLLARRGAFGRPGPMRAACERLQAGLQGVEQPIAAGQLSHCGESLQINDLSTMCQTVCRAGARRGRDGFEVPVVLLHMRDEAGPTSRE